MRTSHRISKASFFKVAVYIIPPVGLSALFFRLSQNDISIVQWLLALILLLIPWSSYLRWKLKMEPGIPVFAIVSFMYWIYYALSLFWGARTVSGDISPREARVTEEALTTALELAVVGVLAAWVGLKTQLSRLLIPKRVPILEEGKARIYIRLLLAVSGLLGLQESVTFTAGEGVRQIITILVTTVPILAFALLIRGYFRGESTLIDKILIAGFLMLRFVVGLSSGWLGSFAAIVVICGAVYLLERRKVPRVAVLLVVVFTLFFQVGKKEFRQTYWQPQAQTSKVDRVNAWVGFSLSKWSAAFTDPSGVELNDAMNSSLSRVSLLTQTANVVEMTPNMVPYQYGRLYSYMAITWIPRFIWPEKPSMSEANRFYQVAYRMSAEEDLETTAIGVGVLPEAYISFGWFGVVGIMFLMGVFYDVYQRMFFAKTSGALMLCVGVALLPQMIGIESQMAAYLGGILQQVLLTLIVFLPVIRLSKPERGSKQLSSNREYPDPRAKVLLQNN